MSEDKKAILYQTMFFQFIPEAERERLTSLFRGEHCAFGDVITAEGDAAEAFYVIVSGRVRVLKKAENGDEIPLNVLTAGAEFGEIGLLEGGIRTATVRCSTDVSLLRLDRDKFLDLIATNPELNRGLELLSRHRKTYNFLRQLGNFGKLPFPALRALLENLDTLTVPAEKIIIRQGDGPGPMYIIDQGRVRVFTETEDKITNIAFLRSGDYFGELSLLASAPRAATVEALTTCKLLSLDFISLNKLMEEFPELRSLLEEHREAYRADSEARIPLDFSQEMLPADAAMHNKLDIDSPAEEESETADDEEPFASAEGFFKGKRPAIRRFPFVSQIDEMDCGAAALSMICRHFGKKISLAHIRQISHTAWDGTSLKGICSAAEELGLAARAFKVSSSNLNRLPLPAIIHYEGNHWIVLFASKRSRMRVADPAVGIRSIPRDEFLERWSGYAAIFEPTEAFKDAPERRPTLAWALPFFRPWRWVLVKCLSLAIVATAMQIAFPVVTQVIVDKVVMDKHMGLLGILTLALLAALIIMVLADIMQHYFLSVMAVKVDTAILDFLTQKLMALPMSYFNRRRTGDIQRRLAGAREIREFLIQSGIGGILAVIEMLAYLGLMAYYSRRLFLLFLITIPFYFGLLVFSRRILRPLFSALEESYGKYSSRQIDAIKGIEAVKASAAEQTFRENILQEFTSLSGKQKKSNFMILCYDNILQSVGFIGHILFLWIGSAMVLKGNLTIGSFVAFNAIVVMVQTPILAALGLWDELQRSAVLLDRLDDIFETEPEQEYEKDRLLPVRALQGKVELVNLGFRYGGPESALILSGISLKVPAGNNIAIVGRSGCGKTTLIKCISGLLVPTEGAIRFDGIDIELLNHQELRRHIGIVLQQNHIFDDTIFQNIAFGDADPDRDRVVWAARLANAHEFIQQLPLGYDTRIGDSGLLLSGGQRQRITIARALYVDPAILIFDEATSALDTESERAIQENMARIMDGRTTFTIAHRLSTIRNADLIIVMDKGRIVERGNHDELMTARGFYYYMCSQQLGI